MSTYWLYGVGMRSDGNKDWKKRTVTGSLRASGETLSRGWGLSGNTEEGKQMCHLPAMPSLIQIPLSPYLSPEEIEMKPLKRSAYLRARH